VVTGMVASTLSGGLPTAGANIVAGASTAANFAKWYVDTPGFNLSKPTSLLLTEGPAGTYTYSNNAFFPIDGQLYGDQGRSHNYHFTMQLEGQLAFSDPALGPNKSFTFTGDDDLWVFVDGKLVLDLGGVHGAATKSFTAQDLKNLGLVAGTPYDLDIFFAERHTSQSNFAITTTLDITSPPELPEPGTLLLALPALAALVARRWRRRVIWLRGHRDVLAGSGECCPLPSVVPHGSWVTPCGVTQGLSTPRRQPCRSPKP
jgi:fibro-slime domain-containing protein